MSVYHVRNRRTIVSTPAGAQNLGHRTVYGLDVHGLVRLWGFWSRILRADEDVPDGEEMPIGDLARHQIHVGAGITQGHWTGSLRARHVGERDTVVTNPIRTVPSHVTADLSLTRRDIGVTGLDLALKLTNVFDAEVLHPGVRGAEAGAGPGTFDEDGSGNGSAGYFSSLLPQPGRAALLTLRFRLPAGR